MERLRHDLKFAIRLLVKDRAFTITTLATLALCIGANATIFAVVNSVLLRPLSVPEPDRLVLLYNSYPRAGVERAANGVPDYYDRLRDVDALEEIALYNTAGMTIGIGGDPQRLRGMLATPSLLRMLNAQPVEGRIFTDAEGEEGNDQKAILTHGLWQQLYAGEPAVGQEIRIDGTVREIVGVLPPRFEFLDPEIRVWIPVAFNAEDKSDDSRHSNNWSMLGRLRPGASVAQVQQQVDALNARNLDRFPNLKEILVNAGFHTIATSLQDDLVRNIRGTLYLLWGAVALVLLIGVVNVTNLVLVRATGRAKELATRHALGAGLTRLTRQLLTETVLLTLVGGAAGAAIGGWGIDALAALGLDRLPRGSEVRVDGTVVAFTMALALGVGVLIGLVPLVNLRHINLSQAFREEGRSGTSGRGARAVRRVLVAGQVALAFMLLIGAGLLLASFQRVLAIEPGFEAANLLTARIAPSAARYNDDASLRTFSDRLLERVRALPGVQSAGLTSSIPFGGDYSDSVILAEGYQMAPGESLISPYRIVVTPGYFETMGMTIRSGRGFAPGDTPDSPRVVIIDERLARRFWGNQDPVGRRMFQPNTPEDLAKPSPNARWYTVVGVVSEVRMSGLIETDARPGAYYFPASQDPFRYLTLTVRTAGDPLAIVPSIRRELAGIDRELPLYGVMTMKQRVSESLIDRRTPMILSAAFAALALFLAAVGIYGVLAYQVSQRTKEIGIRMALGSDASGIFRLVIAEGVVLLVSGLAVGLGGAFLIRRALQSQLYGIGAMDPVIVSMVALMLGAVTLIACTVPARRAARIDPMIALTE